MRVKFILREQKEFLDYRNKLDEIEQKAIPHNNEPRRYPCLAISEMQDEFGTAPEWEHLFIYSSRLEDLYAIRDTLGDPAIKKIIESQEAREGPKEEKIIDLSPKSSEVFEWNKLWDDIEIGQLEHRSSTTKRLQFDEYEEVRKKIEELSFQDAIKYAKTYVQRWPNSPYIELIVVMMKAKQKQHLAPTEKEVEPVAPVSTSTAHDYYPYHIPVESSTSSSTQGEVEQRGPAEPRSRKTREARFANED